MNGPGTAIGFFVDVVGVILIILSVALGGKPKS